ncbi:site-specific integrase [Streptomyces sp. RerS4]|uniref:tyrosine-type recombinase/integrase n=1 Tax=Streptomyces sp. RerS4 TaxID=2942449 RepID=UPI00201C259B|nr:site-specific integrase [Streptomyces sp. RerS4]UQX00899.1 site-specific integrase [Streptomyces sp. RerS4]
MTRQAPRRANSIRRAGTGPTPPRPLFVEHDLKADEDRIGPHDLLSRDEVLALLPTLPAWPQRTYSRGVAPGTRRLAGAAKILDWLLTHPGEGWQARWLAADADRGKEWVGALATGDSRCEGSRRSEILIGLNSLMISKIVLPRHGFLRRFKALTLLKDVQRMFPAGRLDRMREYGAELGMTPRHIDQGLRVISAIILHTGRDLEELTGEDIFHLRAVARRDRGEAYVGTHPAWDLLRGIGVIDSKDTLKDALRHGQRPTAELVDAYNLQSTPIRNMLVRYLEERRPGVDYGTFRGLVSELAGVFWADIEAHHPGIDTLRLPQDVVDGWKERLTTYTDKSGQVRERRSRIDVMMRVRGFYLDIQEWAHDDPFWAQWAVPSPITRGDGAGNHKIVAQVHSRMHQRVRERLPHLPVLLETAKRVCSEAAALLEAARATPFEEVFEHEGTRYLRILPKVNQIPSRLDHGSQHVYIKEVDSTGRRINQSIVEDDAFWAWAAIETLRHTGVRAEELTELTHLALVSYKLPDTGEIVPLLQIVPSKSNEERLLLVSPELASVLATIVKRLRDANDGKIPLVSRYDHHERVTGPKLPHLFQRRPYWQAQVMNETAIKRLLDRTLVATGLRDAVGEPLRYTPHDFRRMFATEAVTGGLPVHIAARILGHKTLTTTQAYLAVFQDDLVRTYRGFLDRRRADRPQEEYREPTDREWRDFQQHFELRKVSLGTCGRPFGTPCKHEHACIRCPVLQIDPRQRGRLIEIIQNLRDRIREARGNGWLGEVEGLQVSLDAATAKLNSLSRAPADGRPQLVELGMPVFTDHAPLPIPEAELPEHRI